MQRIAISSTGSTLDDPVEPRFGRAPAFVILDLDTMELESLDNSASRSLNRGAGICTAERIADAGVDIVLTGFIGDKAFIALKSAGIKVCQNVSGTVGSALQRFQDGGLAYAESPNNMQAQCGGDQQPLEL